MLSGEVYYLCQRRGNYTSPLPDLDEVRPYPANTLHVYSQRSSLVRSISYVKIALPQRILDTLYTYNVG